MKFIKNILAMCLFVLLLASCEQTVESSKESQVPSSAAPTITSVEVTEYDKTVYYGEAYNEESVKVEATYSDSSTITYTSSDLLFDYSSYDPYTVGEQTIRVIVKALNKSANITVEVIKREVKILMISNSFGDDTVQWVHEIGEDLGIEFTIANLYIGGCVLETHLTNLKKDLAAYEYLGYNKLTKTWSKTAKTKISSAMKYEDWDYVVLQQGSYDSGRSFSYAYIDEIMDRVLELKGDVEFLWNMTWAYQQDSGHANFNLYNHDQMTMYNAILNAVQTKVVPNERFKYIIPNGTAVQNARTSVVGDTLCRDVYCHLTYDFGRYIAGLTIVGTVADVDLRDVNYSPDLDLLYKNIAIESAVNALANPFAITPSSY